MKFDLQMHQNMKFRKILRRYNFYMKSEIPISVSTEIGISNFKISVCTEIGIISDSICMKIENSDFSANRNKNF